MSFCEFFLVYILCQQYSKDLKFRDLIRECLETSYEKRLLKVLAYMDDLIIPSSDIENKKPRGDGEQSGTNDQLEKMLSFTNFRRVFGPCN